MSQKRKKRFLIRKEFSSAGYGAKEGKRHNMVHLP